jgi:5-methylcytosine-specific restriction endonuclease McrA
MVPDSREGPGTLVATVAVRADQILTAEAGDSEPGPVLALPRAGRPEQRANTTGRVLVLNASYEPINVCTVRRAAVLLLKNRAEILEQGEWALHAESLTLPRPVVIRLLAYVRIPRDAHRRKITRRAVFARDRWTCQYCGHERGNLTVDHVVPRSKGGASSWDNIVTCCAPCNRRKGARLPVQANMRPVRRPKAPSATIFIHVATPSIPAAWKQYLLVA